MTKHFETREAAIIDLKAHGFYEHESGNWLNDVCAAHILTRGHNKGGAPVVAVQYWEVE